MRFTKKLFGSFAALLFVGACQDMGSSQSSLSGEHDAGAEAGDCTLTQGYWKNHEEAWPVSSLELGNVTYTQADLLEILRTPVRGNGLISLAHQLIAAKLNVAAGADDADISAAIDAADDLIGDLVIGVDSVPTSDVGGLVGDLDAFNNGETGPGHCDDGGGGGSCDNDSDGDGDCDGEEPPPEPVCGNGTVETGEACDDGNVVAHDGCSATCTVEVCECGNGIVESGEACDDGNLVAHDGCSATCTIEVSLCGNGVIDTGEECDDGNLVNGDGCSAACICDGPIL